ncbi:MAG: acyl carrier protein [Clostridia bacterium]|nr:acyl carrier protein [Clostridia bacterium]
MFEKVRAIIADQLNVDAEKITMESSIIEDLGADSLDVVELIMALEENFGVEIPDDDAEKINTIGDIVDYIENH